MKNIRLTNSNTVRVIAVCLVLFINSVRADSWGPPTEFDTPSANRKFVAHVVPGKKDLKPLLIVSTLTKGKTNETWRTQLGNRVSPTQVYLSDDGESVVTLDNYFGVGYGDDVVAIYNRQGRLRAYSLEEIAPLPKSKPDSSEWLSTRRGYEGKFTHTTSSRHWRENSIEFFHHESDQLLFCLWLDWEIRWAVWRTSDGGMMSVSVDLAKRLNAEGRALALKKVKRGGFASESLHFLGRQRFIEDRPLIEALLEDKEFWTGTLTRSFSGSRADFFAYTARSQRRETADTILARWDGAVVEDVGSSDKYRFLGNLKGSVELPAAPQKGEGMIHVYLIPESTPLREWNSARPGHYLTADLTCSYPRFFNEGQMQDGKLSSSVNFIISGVTPGRYRLKAVWDKTEPFSKRAEILCQPRAGDYESTASPLVQVRKGADTEGVRVDCRTLVPE